MAVNHQNLIPDFATLSKLIHAYMNVMIGVVFVFLPVILWLISKGCLLECWDCYVGFNVRYLDSHKAVGAHPWTWYYLAYILVLAIGFVLIDRRRRQYIWLTGMLFTMWIVVAVKPTFEHYFIVLAVPASIAGAILGCRLCRTIYGRCFVGGVLVWCCGLMINKVVHDNPLARRSKMIKLETKKFLSQINEKESVTVLGNDCWIYEVCGIKSPWRYPYQREPAHVSCDIHDAISSEIKRGTSRYIITSKDYRGFPRDEVAACYDVIGETEHYLLYGFGFKNEDH